MSRAFEVGDEALTAGAIRSRLCTLKHLEERLSGYGKEDIPAMLPEAVLENAIGAAEKTALALRTIRERYALIDPEDTDFSLEAFRDLPVTVSFENGVLRVTAPFAFNRDYGSRRNLCRYLGAALMKYASENRSLFHAIPLPLHEVVKRRAVFWNPKRYRDNDNNEIRILSNELMLALGYSDSARNLGYTSVFQKCGPGEEGIEILIFAENRMPEFLDDMRSVPE